ncbi:MAG: hypothetical protein WBX38_07835 [Candidatus Sulfotelmatobacter sp.]
MAFGSPDETCLESRVIVVCAKSQSQEPKSPRFRFGFINDHRDGANHTCKFDADIVSRKLPNIAKGYCEGKLGAVLPLESSLCNCIRYLVFFVPSGKTLHDDDGPASANSFDIGQTDSSHGPNSDDESVLAGITQFVDCKKQIVPCAVRLETAKKPRDFLREAFAATTYATFEVLSGLAEGKMDVIDRQVSEPCHGNGCHFERGSQVFNGVDCVLCKADWKRFAEFELVPFVNAVRIRLDNMLAWCSLEINPSTPFKVGQVFVSPL